MSTFFANFVVSNNLLHLMKIKSILSAAAATLVSLSAAAQERIILVNEGVWQTDNGRLTYFENGKIVGDGTHEALLRSCPAYRQLHEANQH